MPVIQIVGIVFAVLIGLFTLWGFGSLIMVDADWKGAKPLSPARMVKSTLIGSGMFAVFAAVGALVVFTITAAGGGFN